MDPNKQNRDAQRRALIKAGWHAGNGLNSNGTFKWIWIHPNRKRAYSREEAYAIVLRQQS